MVKVPIKNSCDVGVKLLFYPTCGGFTPSQQKTETLSAGRHADIKLDIDCGSVILSVFTLDGEGPKWSGPIPTNTKTPIVVGPSIETVIYEGLELPQCLPGSKDVNANLAACASANSPKENLGTRILTIIKQSTTSFMSFLKSNWMIILPIVILIICLLFVLCCVQCGETKTSQNIKPARNVFYQLQ
jgi:hypothetical protein